MTSSRRWSRSSRKDSAARRARPCARWSRTRGSRGLLDIAYNDRIKQGKRTFDDLKEAVIEGSVRRIRPKIMTDATNLRGFMPILWTSGTGGDMMKRIAAPMVGGLATFVLLELPARDEKRRNP